MSKGFGKPTEYVEPPPSSRVINIAFWIICAIAVFGWLVILDSADVIELPFEVKPVEVQSESKDR